MHRTPLGALTAALALLVAALVVPQSSTNPTSQRPTATVSPVAAAVLPARPSAAPALAPVRFARPTPVCRKGLVALTFDDGPSATVTPGLVRTLQRLGVPATFFMVGSRVHAAPGVARRVQRAGFQVENHSWSHAQLTAINRRAVRSELVRTRQEFVKQRVVAGNLVRPPYGAENPRVRKQIKKLDLVPVLWSIDSLDWQSGNPRQIARRVLRSLRPHGTNIVLQHDGVTNSPNSVKAVPLIVAKARKRGYCFAGLDARGKVAVPVPNVRATALSGTEDGPAAVRIKLELDRPTTRPVSLRVQTLGGTAQPGLDFTTAGRRVTFPRGVRTAWITVPVLDDDLVEPVEDLRVLLDAPHGLRIGRAELPATIFSDD